MTGRGREALSLAEDLRQRMAQWMSLRGISGTLRITPYLAEDGQPNVLIQLNSHAARAMVASLDEAPTPPPPWPTHSS